MTDSKALVFDHWQFTIPALMAFGRQRDLLMSLPQVKMLCLGSSPFLVARLTGQVYKTREKGTWV